MIIYAIRARSLSFSRARALSLSIVDLHVQGIKIRPLGLLKKKKNRTIRLSYIGLFSIVFLGLLFKNRNNENMFD